MNVIDIGYPELILSLVFVGIAGVSSVALKLNLHRDIFWGTVRTVSQLFIMGYILRFLFKLTSPWPVFLFFAVMIAFAGRIVQKRIKSRQLPFLIPTMASMFLSCFFVTAVITGLIVKVRPWYDPVYFIPLAGMIVGNSMNAIAITLERFFGDIRKQRDVIELYLALGANYREASADIFRRAVSAGMIPSINSMMGVGIVFLPGMMTGQILAGADPLVSVKYQIIVMLMLVAATAIGSIAAAFIVRRLCFSADNRLLLKGS